MITVFVKLLMYVNKAKKDGTHSLRLSPVFTYQNLNIDTIQNPTFDFKFQIIIQNEKYVRNLSEDTKEELAFKAEEEIKDYFYKNVVPTLKPTFH